MYHYEFFAMSYVLRVDNMGETLAKGQVVYGIEQVALSHTIVTQKTVDIIREAEVGLGNILEVDDG
jgi:hypothetical protein